MFFLHNFVSFWLWHQWAGSECAQRIMGIYLNTCQSPKCHIYKKYNKVQKSTHRDTHTDTQTRKARKLNQCFFVCFFCLSNFTSIGSFKFCCDQFISVCFADERMFVFVSSLPDANLNAPAADRPSKISLNSCKWGKKAMTSNYRCNVLWNSRHEPPPPPLGSLVETNDFLRASSQIIQKGRN